MDKLIDELLNRHNDDPRDCFAWCLGYINNLEKKENKVKEALGMPTVETLIEDLERDT